MCTKNNKLFNQELFLSLISAIQELGKELSIDLSVSHYRIHESTDEGMLKLNPSISVVCGAVSLKIWTQSIVRTVALPLFKEATCEIMYAEAYTELLRFVLRNGFETLLKAKYAEASVFNSDVELSLPVFKHTSKERKEAIARAVSKLT